MSRRKHKKSQRKKGYLLAFIKFHRWSGLFSLIILVMLSVTGILLNHTEEFALDSSYIDNQWLLKWYGISIPEHTYYLRLDTNTVAQVGQQVYFNDVRLPDETSTLTAAYSTADFIVVVMQKALYLLTADGELIEKMTSDMNLPIPITHIFYSSSAMMPNKYFFQVNNKYYVSEDGFLSWRQTDIADNRLKPVKIQAVSEQTKIYYQKKFLGNKLKLERFIQDLHSGRLFSGSGVYFMDFIAFLLILMALSGFWIWFRRYRKKFNMLFKRPFHEH